jgi:hypothetical protein
MGFNHGDTIWAPSRGNPRDRKNPKEIKKGWTSLEATQYNRTIVYWGDFPDESQGARWVDNDQLMTEVEWSLVQATKGITDDE